MTLIFILAKRAWAWETVVLNLSKKLERVLYFDNFFQFSNIGLEAFR